MRWLLCAGSMLSLLALSPISAAPSAAQSATQPQIPPVVTHSAEQWDNALDEWIVHLKGVHPNAFAKTGELQWRRAAEAFRQDLPRLTEEQRMVRMMQLNGLIGDGHTFLEPDRPDFGIWYPVHIVEFPDGYFVVSAYKTERELAGAQVIEIAGRPVSKVAAAARSLIGADNQFGARFNLGSLHNAALMHGLGYAAPDHSLEVKLRLANGKIVVRTLPSMRGDSDFWGKSFSRNDWEDSAETLGPIGSPDDWITAFNGEPASAFRVRNDNHPIHLTLRRALVTRNIPQAHAYYVQANIVDDAFDESFRHLFRRAMAEIDASKPKNIILDLRFNPGGDGSRIPELIPLFARHVGPQQNLYVLTGPKTFSAAILWLDAFVDYLHPTVVGEPAGAAFNSFGDPHEYPLPQIGVTTHISTVRHQGENPTSVAAITPVDVPAPMTFADWRSGRDPAVDPIVAGKEMRSFAQIALADGAEAARKAFADRQGLADKYPWWTPPPEIDLRRAVQNLAEDGRYDDAIAIGEISTKFHPAIWNSWYNLGQAQLADGRLTEAQASLRKVLELDPNNFNKDELAAIAKRSADTEFTVPALLQWGAALPSLEEAARRECQAVATRPISPPFLASVKRSQQQIACDGFRYQGAPRHLELIIRDGELVGAWLMMRPEEQERVLAWMKRDLNEPAAETSNYVVYPKHMVAWRKDKAELLFYSPQLRAEVQTWWSGS